MAWSAALATPLVAALAGCGPDITEESVFKTVAPDTERVEAPEPAESLDEAIDRIESAVEQSGCEAVYELVPSSRSQSATPERCEFLKGLAGLELVDGEEYGEEAAVLDFRSDDRFAVVALIRDDDGLYRLAVADFSELAPVVGTERPTGSDEVAADAVEALRDRSCPAWNVLLSHNVGPGTASPEEVCATLRRKSNVLALAAETDPVARADPLGGNGKYAFYGLSTARGYFVLVVVNDPVNPNAPEPVDTPKVFDVFAIGEIERSSNL